MESDDLTSPDGRGSPLSVGNILVDVVKVSSSFGNPEACAINLVVDFDSNLVLENFVISVFSGKLYVSKPRKLEGQVDGRLRVGFCLRAHRVSNGGPVVAVLVVAP